MTTPLKKVIIINTGGTIAMKMDSATGSVHTATEQPLRSANLDLQKYARCEMIDLFNVPSPSMTPEMMCELSNVVREQFDKNDIAGIVITHGTDTLEETAYYLDLTVSGNKPVVITGAMRSSNELGSDGLINLIQSIRVVIDDSANGRGTMVVFNDEIHAARDVTKTHTSNVATFQSPAHGAMGIITKKQVTFYQPANRQAVYTVPRDPCAQQVQPEVPIVKAITGVNPKWLQFLLYAQIDGVVLEAFGAGNVPPAIIPTLRALIARNIPVVMVSRCYNGYVQDLYGYAGGGQQLREMGVIFCNALNSQKARIKLMVLLSAGISLPDISALF